MKSQRGHGLIRDVVDAIKERLILSLWLTPMLLISLTVSSFAPLMSDAHPSRWRVNASEAEASEIIRELLIEAELSPDKIRRGSYPLFGYHPPSVLPFISAPCPMLLSCEELVKRLKVSLIDRGYRLIYSDQSPRPGGPIHYAIARGKRPVLALRLNPAHSSVTALLRVNSTLISHQATLYSLPAHVSFALHNELINSAPLLIERLVEQQRELYIEIDELMIKRALINPDSGAVILESDQRRAQLGQELESLFKRLPSSVGIYLSGRALRALDRALSDELVQRCAAQHRVIVTAKTDDHLLTAISRGEGVRSLALQQSISSQSVVSDQVSQRERTFTERLKSLEATLVLSGELSFEVRDSTPQHLRELNLWIERLSQRQVSLFRISEHAW